MGVNVTHMESVRRLSLGSHMQKGKTLFAAYLRISTLFHQKLKTHRVAMVRSQMQCCKSILVVCFAVQELKQLFIVVGLLLDIRADDLFKVVGKLFERGDVE